MNIKSLKLKNFMNHSDTSLDLPARGIVLITGANGSGKSSLLEAVSFVHWGETIRGTSPWPKALAGEATVVSDRASVTRKRTKAGKLSLSWAGTGQEATTFENNSKAEAALEALVGPWEVWRRCSLFSSADATHFSLATDSERKRLLERVLGIEKFDVALEACRKDLKAADLAVTNVSRALEVESERLRSESRRLAEATSWLGEAHAPIDLEALKLKAADLKEALAQTNADLDKLQDALKQGAGSGAEYAVLARQIRTVLDRLRGDTCPTCTQPIPTSLRDKLEKEAQTAQAKHAESASAAEAENAVMADQYQELREEANSLSKRLQEVEYAYRSAKQSAERDAQVRTTMVDAEKAVATFTAKVEESKQRLQAATVLKEELLACEQVLGLKGVRAHVLARALGGIEAVANVWLSRVSGKDLQLKLSPYTEKKTGGVSDSISLEIVGAGDGHGYRAASAGERRRLDVALLLSLAEVASAAHSNSGTLFFDEVFDLLDQEGVQCIRDVLDELAETRCVVIISHSDLVQQMGADMHIHMDSGVPSVRA